MEERINPIIITDNETSETYTLDFNRDAIRFAEAREFVLEEVTKYPNTKIPEFFYYAFRTYHKKLARNQTDAILEKLGGLTPAMVGRLSELYNQAALTHVFNTEEESAKNAKMTVEL